MELVVIQNKIYELRGVKVMLDRDLAQMYQVTTGNLNKAVKRNIERFPAHYMFQLTKEESLRFQFGILDNTPSRGQYSKYLPYAFTEQGVSMLASVLRSEIAVGISINIIDAFVEMRRYLMNTATVSAELSEIRAKLQLLERNDEDNLEAINDLSEDMRRDIDNIYLAMAELSVKPAKSNLREPMGYKIDANE